MKKQMVKRWIGLFVASGNEYWLCGLDMRPIFYKNKKALMKHLKEFDHEKDGVAIPVMVDKNVKNV